MYLRVEYTETENDICICRCYGYEDVLVIPDKILGKPVTALYDYALSSSSPRKEPKEVRQIVLNEEEQGFAGECALEGEFLREVYLPSSLKRIGDYAFYMCRNLHTIHFQGELEYLGGGAFVWCRGLSRLTFCHVPKDGHGIYSVLAELTQELETEILWDEGTELYLTVPEYYEESVENTPARIIDIHWHGSGYKYRQCFSGGKLDLRHYDELFPYAVANEFPGTCISLALNRLRTPVQLSDGAREAYTAFLKAHMEELLRTAIREDDLEKIRFLALGGLLDREDVEQAAELAARRQSAEIGSFLMDYQREHFRPKKKTFEL